MTIQHPAELTEADRATLQRAGEIAALRGADVVRRWAGANGYDVSATLSAYVELAGIAQVLLGDLSDIVRRLGIPIGDDVKDDDDLELDQGLDYYCRFCGAPVGHFIGYDGWHHYRGEGTPASPVELYDAGHPAEPGGMPS